MILDLTNKLVCFYLKFDRYTNGYYGKEKNCQFTLDITYWSVRSSGWSVEDRYYGQLQVT